MYCVRCGVELADSEKRCPLCGTPVFHPDLPRPEGEPPFPTDRQFRPEEVNRSGSLFLVTALCLLPVVIVLLCDWHINGRTVWSGYAALAIVLLYILVFLPMWFRSPNPIVFVPVDFAAICLYLLYVNCKTGGHWFLSFALPVTAAVGLLVTAQVTLLRCVRRGHLYIIGGSFLLMGGLMVLIEFLLNVTFRLHRGFLWSLYPLACFTIIGVMLLIVAVCRPLRESLERKFFV